MKTFLDIEINRYEALIVEAKCLVTELLEKDPQRLMTNEEFFKAIYEKTSAKNSAEFFVIGVQAHRLLEEQMSQEALKHFASHVTQHGVSPLGAGRKAD